MQFNSTDPTGDDHTDSLAFINGREALERANYQAAINNFSILIERHPNDPQYRFLRAKAFLGLSAFALCLHDLDEAIALGLDRDEIRDLRLYAAAEQDKRGISHDVKPDFLALVALRRDYRVHSLVLSVDESLAESKFSDALKMLDLAERLAESTQWSDSMNFNLGRMRATALLGLNERLAALKVVDFHLNHAYAVRNEEQVRLFKMLRSQAYS
jgi:hypothetical protein